MVLGWHAFAFFCIWAMVTHVIISLIMDILKDLESNEGPIWPKDMHDNIVMLEYLYWGHVL